MASILGIDTIQHQSGTTAMTIDNSGRVSTPVKPSFFVTGHQSSTTSFTTGGESATINGVTPENYALMYNYHNVHHNVGSHFNNASGRFTCPVAGLYLVTGHVGFTDASNYFGLSLFVTSSARANLADVTCWSDTDTDHQPHSLHAHVNASVGQQFLMAYKTGYANPRNESTSAPYASFGATFIG